MKMGKRLMLMVITGAMLGYAEAQSITLAERGRAKAPILIQAEATAPERYAAEELRRHLEQITGAPFEIRTADPAALPPTAILIGPGDVARQRFPDIEWDKLGSEQVLMRTQGRYLLLAGGRPRGTLYAVYRFLHTYCGVRWWTPWASTIPRRRTLRISPLNVSEQPAFEYREPFWYHAFDGDWAARHYYNGHHARLEERHGGKIQYVGFVHTFYALVPPEQYFERHPEWFSLIDGKRQWERAQLCTTNPQLRAFLVERVREWLNTNPQARLVSISQNDWTGACQCDTCRALDEREGTPAGSVLEMVNFIAEQLERAFPDVAFDTLAYWYTRRAPKSLRPRPNVIVRLCSIECNFAQPLEHPSNEAFARDIRDWSRLTNRLYVWDYTTNFAHYIMPHPNWFSLGPNVRFFHQHGVRGLFEQGAYQSHGAEMAELRAWVLAQLLWNPYQDDQKLIDEFLRGYYGKAARFIRQYLNLMHEAAKDFYMGCFTPPDKAPYLRYEVLAKAEALWEQAEHAVQHDPELRWRVHIARLPLWYAWLVNWDRLRQECEQAGTKWVMPLSKEQLAHKWLQIATGDGPPGWTRITHVNEAGLTPEQFVKNILK
jgi:hypothetical protein